MKVLALDFDGVICDSATEVFLVGLRTYINLVPESSMASNLAERYADPSRLPDLPADPTFLAFSKLTPLGNRAEDFGVALRIIDERVRISDQQEYDAYYEALDPRWLEAFHTRFYAERGALRDHDLEAWLGLHAPYRPLIDVLEQIRDRVRLAIATAKDGRSVRLLLDRFGIDSMFPPQLLIDKEVGVHKTEHLRALAQRLAVGFADITFVDDKVNHLLRVAPLGVRPVLAGWGYNSEREHELGRRHGFPVATFENAKRILVEGSAA